MTAHRRFLVFLLLATAGASLGLLGVEWWYREGPNNSRIEEGLYMGGQVKQPPPGTTAVLNLCEREDPYRCETYRWEPIPDAAPAPDLDWLRRMVEFIDSKRREGATIYVHCKQGVSRAGMVITAYEMFKNGWTRDEALAFVRSHRPVVRPNPAFMELLAEWERVIKERKASAP
jgi:hypothetical protein